MNDLQAILDKGGPWQQARIIGDQLLIQGDCREVMAVLPKVCGVLTDPPFGIGEHGGAQRTRGKPGYAKHEKREWDKERPPRDVFLQILNGSYDQIIWGGNYFADWLPARMGWLYWQKKMGGDFSDGELAWTSRQRALREFTKCPKGMDKSHPCEKPVALMEWCLGFLPDARTILDPFAGSFTTAVACQRLGRQSISIELDPDYYEIGLKRVQEVVNNPPLFTPAPPKPIQEGFDL